MKTIQIVIAMVSMMGYMAWGNMKPLLQSDSHPPGLKTFLQQPQRYGFTCGCEQGQIRSACLSGDALLIEYEYPCRGEERTGQIQAHWEQKAAKFKGTYNTQNGRFFGDIQFSFNLRGEGQGSWGQGAGSLEMKLIDE